MSGREEDRLESTSTASGGSGDDPEVTDLSTPKVCVVCDDRALSCNFGAITCESCKAFFRRNAAKNWTSKCDGNCPITVETRSYCKKCRLAKCFEVGMNKSLILTDEQKRLRKQKIFENKVRRGNVGGFEPNLPDVCLVTPQDPHHSLPSPVLPLPHPIHCLPRPPATQPLNTIHSAFPYHGEKQGFERSTVNSTGNQNSQSQPTSSTTNISKSISVEETQREPTVFPVELEKTAIASAKGKEPVDAVRPCSRGISEVSSHMVSTTLGYQESPYNREAGSQDSSAGGNTQHAFFVKEYSPDSKKHRTSSTSSSLSPQSVNTDHSLSTDVSSQSDSMSESVLQQTGIVCTTLKILMDSQSYKSGLENLIPPIVVPNYPEIFSHPALLSGDLEFIRHIHQLENAMTCAFAEAKQHNKCPKDPNYTQIFNFSETSIKCLVKMAKNLEPFLKLDTDDQILLLKNSILEMMVLGSAASYDPQQKGWHVRDGSEVRLVSTKAVKSSRDGLVLMCHYEMIILCVLSSTKRDLGLLSLLTVLSLFSTKTQRVPMELHNKAKVDSGYQVYWGVLQRYVSLKYSSPSSQEEQVMVDNLAKASDIVRDFSETYIQSILKLPFDRINPLLLEIFDLPYT